MPSFVQQRLRSFRYAFTGLALLIRTQPNMWIHLLASMAVTAAAFYFSISRLEWIAVIFAIALVCLAEALNTAVEFLGDAVSREQNELVGKSKDLAAGAVLLASFAAFVTGLLIFLPYLIQLPPHPFPQ